MKPKTPLSIAVAILLVAVAAMASDAPLIDAHLTTRTTARQILDARGPFSMSFRLAITNRSNDPVTLTRVEVRTDENSGFALADGVKNVHTVIAPGETETIWLSAKRLAPDGMQRTEALQVSVRTMFHARGGKFVKDFGQFIP